MHIFQRVSKLFAPTHSEVSRAGQWARTGPALQICHVYKVENAAHDASARLFVRFSWRVVHAPLEFERF